MVPVQFILGRAGTGKTHHILESLACQLRADPLGDPLWLIVPDQATLLYERLLVGQPGLSGYARARVSGFRQFGQRILEQVGGLAVPEITAVGRRMLIGRLLRTLQDQLAFYGASGRQPGVADALDALFAEFEDAGLSTDDLTFLSADIEAQTPASALPAKLRDLKLLYEAYSQHLGQDRLDPHRRFRQMNDALARAPSLSRSAMYVDGFYEFTRQERDLLAAVARGGCKLQIALRLDPRDEALARSDAIIDESHPLRRHALALRQLCRTVDRAGVAIAPSLRLTEPRRFVAPELKRLEARLLDGRREKPQPAPGVRFIEATSRQDEVRAAARQVRDWLEAGMRLRDIAVLTRRIDDYQRDVESIFAEHGIRHFIDRHRSATFHPLLQVCRAALAVAVGGWPHEAVMTLAKSALTAISTDDAHRLENYTIRHRIAGAAWTDPAAWTFKQVLRDGEDEARLRFDDPAAEVERARRGLVAGMTPLLQSAAGVRPAGVHAAALLRTLDVLGVRTRLAEWVRDDATHADTLERSEEHVQVWSQLAELLQQMADVLGDEPMSLDEFAQVLDVGLERFALAIVPPTLDQVIVGSVERTRFGPIRAIVVLGLADGQFPGRVNADAVLPDHERQQLIERNYDLRDTSRQRLFDEQRYAYLALTRSSEFLTITRASTDGGGAGVNPSQLYLRLRELFELNPVESFDGEQPGGIYTPPALVSSLLKWATDGECRDPTLATVYEEVVALLGRLHGLRETQVRPTWAALSYRNSPALSPDVAAKLFASPLYSSISRIESFAACPFQHFARYGLKLQEARENVVGALDLGVVYHGVLDRFVRHAIARKLDLREPLPEGAVRIRKHAQELAQEVRDQILLSNKRNQHMLERVVATLEAVIESHRHLLELGSLDPAWTELSFGESSSAKLPPLEIKTPRGRSLRLRGQIDRVDLLPGGRVAVIDYKSSATRPDFDRIWLGLGLQLLTYLLVMENEGEKLHGAPLTPVAAFYLKLSRPIESIKHPQEAGSPLEPAFHLRDHKPRGFIHNDVMTLLDEKVGTRQSLGYNFRVPKDPEKEPKHRRGDLLTAEAFAAVLAWARRKLGELADQIVDGEIAASPYRLGEVTPCPHCAYRAACRHEPAQGYRLHTPQPEQSLNKIVEAAAQEQP